MPTDPLGGFSPALATALASNLCTLGDYFRASRLPNVARSLEAYVEPLRAYAAVLEAVASKASPLAAPQAHSIAINLRSRAHSLRLDRRPGIANLCEEQAVLLEGHAAVVSALQDASSISCDLTIQEQQ